MEMKTSFGSLLIEHGAMYVELLKLLKYMPHFVAKFRMPYQEIGYVTN